MLRRSAASVLFLLTSCLPPFAAAQTAAIAGTVTDSTAAVVPEATITARDLATNISRTARTDQHGNYRVPSLSPGIYDVLFEHPGFKAVEYSEVELAVDTVQNLSPTLVPSAVEQKITVVGGDVPLVDLDDAQIGNLV